MDGDLLDNLPDEGPVREQISKVSRRLSLLEELLDLIRVRNAQREDWQSPADGNEGDE